MWTQHYEGWLQIRAEAGHSTTHALARLFVFLGCRIGAPLFHRLPADIQRHFEQEEETQP